MDSGDSLRGVACQLCWEAFSLPEDDLDGNLPRMLLCAHVYCTTCLLSIHCAGVIRCPQCEVVSTLPEGGVFGLQEDSRIIGLIYTSKMNKMKRCDRARTANKHQLSPSTDINDNTEDVEQPADMNQDKKKKLAEALTRAAENLAALPNIHEALTVRRAEQLKRERARLELEITQAADEALHAVQKWKDVQLSQLTAAEARFSSSLAQWSRVQKRRKALEIAMQMAREVQRVPSLEQYCSLDKVLETLQAPVDKQSYNIEGITMDSEMSCVFQSECLNQSLALSLKMEVGVPKQQSAKERIRNSFSPKPEQQSPAASRPSSRGSSPRHRSATSEPESPDVIVEELLIEGQEKDPPAAVPPTGPELANDNGRIHSRRNQSFVNKKNVTQWVVVSHVVNPSNFYVRYVAEKRESEILSKKIKHFCYRDSCCFTSRDTVETGSLIFVKSEEGVWCRANLVEVFQIGCVEAVKTCQVSQLARVLVFLLDSGLGQSLVIQGEEGTPESALKAMNGQLRKVGKGVKVELDYFAPQAIRCSLKDLVPYDLTKGWSKEAQLEFVGVVGSAAVEMRPLGRDRDSLLVDLRKAPMDQASDVPVSVREYLVFIEVARFYSPVKLGRRPLLYYSAQYPKISMELNAVVSHIHSPADFYIQLVDNMEFVLLSAKIQDCYNATRMTGEDDDLRIYCPVIEQACVALYEDKLWYRAQVIGHPGGRKVEVQYVDFGNKTIVSVSDLRKIKDEFFAIPSRAIHCCLSDVVPLDGDTWSDACSNRFISLAHQKLVTIMATEKVPKTEPLPIKLFESGLNGPLDNIAELLVNEQLASFKQGLESPAAGEPAVWDAPLELAVTTEGVAGEPVDFLPQLKLLDELKDLKVRVSHVNSPSSFYVQFVQFNAQLKRMCELVKECELLEHQDLVWKADQYCAAKVNGVWERGRVVSHDSSRDFAQVMRCDHGNEVKLHVSDLRPLLSSLTGSLALECTLTDIRPAGGRPTWSATACDLISFYLTGASAVLTIKELTDERPVPVTLFCSNQMGKFVSIADFLASEGLGLRERKPRDADVNKSKETDAQSPVSETQTDCSDGDKRQVPTVPCVLPRISLVSCPKPAPRTITSAEKVKTGLYRPPELPGLGPVEMRVSAIGEDGVIYTTTQNAECQLERLRERIQQSMKTLPRQKPYTWKTVQGCAVIGPDMLWYRGQLLEVLGGHVKVQYVDSGLVENIPVVHVYPVLLCDDIPQLCMSCQLHSINPVGGQWQRDAVALMRKLLLNRRVDMNVTELPADPRGPLTVELFLDGLSLNRILTHHEHASMDRTVSPPKGHSESPPALLNKWDIDIQGLRGPEEPMLGPFIYPNLPQEGEPFQVKVKHLRTPNELFLWPLEGAADVEVDGETLDEALTRINADIGAAEHLADFHLGGPCLAEYSDGKFYRAQINKFSGVEPVRVLVQHVDFGSEDPLPTSRLRRMPAELLRFPLQALKVRVAGFKAPSGSGQEDMLSYSPAWSLKATMDMLDMLHGDITASIVAREPELTVLLYNEAGELVHLPLVSSGLAELE
ncbi:RING finger protein 17 [Cyclopterus lumpus]|uniref:RING finger protein 17 n=1 Tax=Cyclopterus lumpus TaxID=8103 RepID=UPI00148670D2|nr:RING finger protein 17 [Cyclopterus lumpus]